VALLLVDLPTRSPPGLFMSLEMPLAITIVEEQEYSWSSSIDSYSVLLVKYHGNLCISY
jgi:hypothetical protein